MRPWTPPLNRLYRPRAASCELSLDTTAGPVSCEWSSDGQEIFVGCDDGVVRAFSINSETQTRALTGHTGTVLAVACSSTGGRVATASADATAKIWDGTTAIHTLARHTEVVWSVAFSRDGARLATGSDDHTMRVWDARSGATLTTCHAASTLLGVRGAEFGMEKSALSLTHTGVLLVWDRGVEQPLAQFAVAADVLLAGRFCSLVAAPDRRRFAAARHDGVVCLFAADAPLSKLSFHGAAVTSLDWSQAPTVGNRWLASAGEDGMVCVWDLTARSVAATIEHPSPVRAVAFHPDGHHLATVADDLTLRIFRLGCDWFEFDDALEQAETLVSGGEVALWPISSTALDLDVFLDIWGELRVRGQHMDLGPELIDRGRRLRLAILEVIGLLCDGVLPDLPDRGIERYTHPLYKVATVDYGLALDLAARLGATPEQRAKLDPFRPGSRSIAP